MTSVICTLFEGHYHFGVAALANSLHQTGFQGSIYAGYRGVLPAWASAARDNCGFNWPGAKTLQLHEGLSLHFLPVDTDYHLTNYKPDFMLQLWQGPAAGGESLFYFDPDIVVTAPWSFFQDWVHCGVALCEDVNSPLEKYHPRRVAWRKYFGEKGFDLQFKNNIYVNGGFVGVKKKDEGFLQMWKHIQEAMASVIGGLNRSAFKSGGQLPKSEQGPLAPFSTTDQDALNAAVEGWEGAVSLIGKEAMAFKPGFAIMPHALGQPKPWDCHPVYQILKGRAPRLVDRNYWNAANGVIQSQPRSLVLRRKAQISFSAFVGRFYKRSQH
ncbi:hypothetical protein V9K67_05780 [Paraflavisolibacter sp. H34]|uniref:hypothetical protein n=1 Tax=Huijunlia imazamoxiresistens TaxID=3127457 RepID=UPI00301B3A0E